jgi:hypothetical protein
MRPAGAVYSTVLALALLISAPQPGWSQECISGTVTVSISTDPGFDNMYMYCLEVTWDLGRHDLGLLDIFLQLENCECICDPRFIQFSDPAGSSSSSGDYGNCDNDFYGEYVCVGDPSLPELMMGPAIKYDPKPATCAPGLIGTGLFCFYSPMPPGPATMVPDGLVIKHGQQVCAGDLLGILPICNCYLQQEPGTWGQLKATYR